MAKWQTFKQTPVWIGASLLSLVFVLLLTGPVFVLGGGKNIYVDKDNQGSEDGSKDHPYRSIDKALRKAKKGSNVFVAKGRYKVNLVIPKDVKVIGGKQISDVVIEGERDEPTVTLKDDAEIKKVTIKGGRHGIRVEPQASAKIIEVVIKESVRDGIHIDPGTLEKKDEVYIEKTTIKDNKMAGIFSKRRSLVVLDSDILRNGDGVDLTGGVKAWFQDNRISDNRGSGLKITLDGTSFWSRDLSIRRNGREGVEVNAYGAKGSIGFKKSTFIDNGRYGIAKVMRGTGAEGALKNIFLETSRLEGNASGNISRPLWQTAQ